jgi:hypothetical protein
MLQVFLNQIYVKLSDKVREKTQKEYDELVLKNVF